MLKVRAFMVESEHGPRSYAEMVQRLDDLDYLGVVCEEPVDGRAVTVERQPNGGLPWAEDIMLGRPR